MRSGASDERQAERPPIVFVEKQANAMRISAVTPGAAALGLTPGLSLADARARVPDLLAIDRDHGAERRLLGRIAAACIRYTPMVAAEPPDGLVLDISGCTHPYGDEAGLTADLSRRLKREGIAHRAAIAATPEAARALARFGSSQAERVEAAGRSVSLSTLRQAQGEYGRVEALKALPVAALEAAPEVELALRRAGLKTIGDLAARPRAMLAARFGDLPIRLARLLEEEDRRITPDRPLPAIAAVRRFAEPIARMDHALSVLGELVAETGVALEARGQGGRRFEARFFRSDGAVRALAVETGRPARDPAMLMRLFRERIEGLRDPIDPGFGFDLIRLDIARADPMAADQPGFDEPARIAEETDALIDRLATRMGRGRLRRAAPRESHIPERATLSVDPAAGIPAWRAPMPGEPPLRPLHIFDPPQPVEVMAEVPDGAPKWFRWRGRDYVTLRSEGPERIAAEWWRRRKNQGLIRDYYRVEDVSGRRFWLFRSGLYGEQEALPRWYLHGLFA
ncbi:nucleotidyltransferase [Sphingomonas oleivorans]|uniref:Nucleotidyltransferase n=1 Tax=Sphingomonas oleivorans TaxID=1735121 RepID=A0A2T5FV68_9SPHN|nr:DUF6504 family protein [Sphingomonas oleivorans]PTQ08626.1 nucleotidyltransferase [Sphingomonas oleivorans]